MCSSFERVCSSSFIQINPLVGSPLSPADPKRVALEQCIARIKLVVQKVQLEILSGRLSKLNCPITADFPEDPVVTNCGHLFDRDRIEQWKNQGNPCVLCRAPLTQFTPIHALREFIEERLSKDPILTQSNFKGPDQELATQYLALAKSCIHKENYAEALDAYKKAFQYTNASADYAPIPEIYERLRESEKATLSRLYLSLYQLQEGKIQKATETLESCRQGALKVDLLIVGLKLQLDPSRENIEWAMKEAEDQNNSDDRIFIYKQILGSAPHVLDVYLKLVPLTKDPKEQRELLLKAAEIPLISKVVSNVISKEEWAVPRTINLPPYPPALKNFLAGDCTIWRGKKRSETHIVVPLFPQVVVKDDPIPLTLNILHQLDKNSGGPGFKRIWSQIPKDIPAETEFYYAVMTNDVIPESRNKSYDAQLQLLPAGYEVPGVFDAARAILWENRRSGKQCFTSKSGTYTRCREIIEGHHLIVGNFSHTGLYINKGYINNNNGSSDCKMFGIAGWRNFRLL